MIKQSSLLVSRSRGWKAWSCFYRTMERVCNWLIVYEKEDINLTGHSTKCFGDSCLFLKLNSSSLWYGWHNCYSNVLASYQLNIQVLSQVYVFLKSDDVADVELSLDVSRTRHVFIHGRHSLTLNITLFHYYPSFCF